MQYEESASLGERLLDQALRAVRGVLAEVDDASWERVVREGGARSKEELLADIGLGKRLPAVVARRLLKRYEPREEGKASVTIRGTEGMAVQLASCCRPIPATTSSARSRKARAWSCTNPIARASCARAKTSPISGSTSNGIRAPAACSSRRCTSWWRTSAACWRGRLADRGSRLEHRFDHNRGRPRPLHHHAHGARGGESPALARVMRALAPPAGRQEDYPRERIAR